MIRKKGILMDNVLGLIVAAIGIGLLIFFAAKLYGASVVQDEEKARTIIDSLEGKINNFNEGETGKVTIQGVSGWFIAGWGVSDVNRPDSCFFGSCLCICKGAGGNAKLECKNKGFCREFKETDEIWTIDFFSWIYDDSLPGGAVSFKPKINFYLSFINDQIYEFNIIKSKTGKVIGIVNYQNTFRNYDFESNFPKLWGYAPWNIGTKEICIVEQIKDSVDPSKYKSVEMYKEDSQIFNRYLLEGENLKKNFDLCILSKTFFCPWSKEIIILESFDVSGGCRNQQ